jgi:uncharacterized protein YdhG (YjbR/CyaY superfamily)
MADKPKFTTVDEYIESFPEEVRGSLQRIRDTIKAELPDDATEVISYGIPTFKVNGEYVIYFSGWKDHFAVYPIPHNPGEELSKKLEPFESGKGTLRFDFGEAVPFELIKELVPPLLQAARARK